MFYPIFDGYTDQPSAFIFISAEMLETIKDAYPVDYEKLNVAEYGNIGEYAIMFAVFNDELALHVADYNIGLDGNVDLDLGVIEMPFLPVPMLTLQGSIEVDPWDKFAEVLDGNIPHENEVGETKTADAQAGGKLPVTVQLFHQLLKVRENINDYIEKPLQKSQGNFWGFEIEVLLQDMS
jgi:hypothetical protein